MVKSKKELKKLSPIKQEFIKFLKSNRAYSVYSRELAKRNLDFDEFFEDFEKYIFIGGGFTWDSTEKDVDFWADLNGLWEDYLDEKTKS